MHVEIPDYDEWRVIKESMDSFTADDFPAVLKTVRKGVVSVDVKIPDPTDKNVNTLTEQRIKELLALLDGEINRGMENNCLEDVCLNLELKDALSELLERRVVERSVDGQGPEKCSAYTREDKIPSDIPVRKSCFSCGKNGGSMGCLGYD